MKTSSKGQPKWQDDKAEKYDSFWSLLIDIKDFAPLARKVLAALLGQKHLDTLYGLIEIIDLRQADLDNELEELYFGKVVNFDRENLLVRIEHVAMIDGLHVWVHRTALLGQAPTIGDLVTVKIRPSIFGFDCKKLSDFERQNLVKIRLERAIAAYPAEADFKPSFLDDWISQLETDFPSEQKWIELAKEFSAEAERTNYRDLVKTVVIESYIKEYKNTGYASYGKSGAKGSIEKHLKKTLEEYFSEPPRKKVS